MYNTKCNRERWNVEINNSSAGIEPGAFRFENKHSTEWAFGIEYTE